RCCRSVIQSCGRSIRATHRGEGEVAAGLASEARVALHQAQEAVAGFPAVVGAGFVHDAEKEYAEAVLFERLVWGRGLEGHEEVGVGPAAWLNGLAEAASELRRHTLDTLRRGDIARAEASLAAMDEVYGVLIGIDYPDAVTGGLRRTTDALRAVLERTRSDVTTTLLQTRLQESIDRALAATEPR
ncbi:MAG: haloacid dehalogenase, partial [Chloroflexi bacterium]|nr:haloacid dehalogenase [Chloroflexota bacterium]